MKSNVKSPIITIDREGLEVLMTEVKETLATDYKEHAVGVKQRSFSVIDLWNCRNKMRTAKSLRRL